MAHNLTLEYLSELWDKQQGICPYTGLKMILKENCTAYNRGIATPYQASIDRIDSRFGYIQGNVEFVCLAANYAKNFFAKQEMLDFFKQIKLLSVPCCNSSKLGSDPSSLGASPGGTAI